eukprot:scaffold21.g2172.t1
MAEPYITNEQGERVIAASRRPDGTLRKERRVRAGYVPQDEMPVYQSRGTLAKQGVPKCPGAVDGELSAASKPKTKAAAKNAKRKEKRQGTQAEGGAAAPAPAAAAAAAATAGLQSLSLGGSGGGGAAPAAAAAAPAEEAAPEKQLRALRKKVRQAEGLVAKQAEGAALTEEELAKLGRLEGWRQEVAALEAALGTA